MRLIRAMFLFTILSTMLVASVLWQNRPIVWSSKSQITNSSGDSRLVDISADPSGRSLYLVWQDNRAGIAEVYFKRSLDDGVTWGPDIRLSNLTPQTVDPEPRVAALGSEVLVFFANRTSTGEHLFYVVSYNEGAGFSAPMELTHGQGDQSNPAIAVADSVIHLVWQDISDGEAHIFYSKSQDFGRTWQGEVPLTNGTAGQDQYPEIAATGDRVFVTWSRMSEGAEAVYVRVSLDSGVTWQPEVEASDYQEQAYPEFPAIASNGSNAYLVWGTVEGIQYSRTLDSGETWSTPLTLTNTSRQYVAPRIAVALSNIQVVTAGIAAIPAPLSDIFYVSSFDGGETWNETVSLTANKPGAFALAPTIWSKAEGTFIAWEDNSNGHFAIFLLSRPDFLLLHAFKWRLVAAIVIVLGTVSIAYLGLELRGLQRAKRRGFKKKLPHRKRSRHRPTDARRGRTKRLVSH